MWPWKRVKHFMVHEAHAHLHICIGFAYRSSFTIFSKGNDYVKTQLLDRKAASADTSSVCNSVL